MSPVRVSVVVTCFNLGEYLEEALSSVRAQTFRDHEVIVVDDGSTEPATLAALDACRADGVPVLRLPNSGLSAARNAGIAATSAEFICCLDADDRLRPMMLERSVAELDAHPDMSFASHWLATFGDEQSDWRPDRCDFPALLDANTVNGAALVRRAAVAAVGGYDETMRDGCEDWDLWISLVEHGYRGAIIPEVLFDYRRRSDSMSRTMLRRIGHPELYRRLAAKHVASYRRHLPALLLRRERDFATMRGHLSELETEALQWLHPERAGLRDDVRILEAKVDRGRADERSNRLEQALASERESRSAAESNLAVAQGQLAAERAAHGQTLNDLTSARQALDRAVGEGDRLAAELSESLARLAQAGADALRLDASRHRAEEEIAALRASASWRVTRPLRRIYELVTGRGGQS